ncbi:MAG: FAD-dependent oxidoreductase [Pirellulaceae bacterium]|nr:FAD-dependent oxidoreductase [Pirellulaceae bacterium]
MNDRSLDSPGGRTQDRPTVAVIGGGLAGLAAALKLGERGWAVELFEARRTLGGRAGAFRQPDNGQWIDHCQHVGMDCCTNWLDFCRRLHIGDGFRRDKVLHFFGPDGRPYRLRAAGWLPAPLHLGPSLLAWGFLPWRDRWSIAGALLRLARYRSNPAVAEPTIGQWLRQQRQSEIARRRFWSVVLVSALGETLDRASLSAARKVFVDGFLASRSAFQLLIPREPLGELYGERLLAGLGRWPVRVHCERPVRGLHGEAAGVRCIELADGTRREYDACVLAVPWRRVAGLLCDSLRAAVPAVERLEAIDSSPITAVHLWLDRPIMHLPHAVLVDRLSQWVFRHGPDLPPDAEHYYQVVISASRELAGRPREDVLREVLDDLAAVWPAARLAGVTRWRMVTQQEAVFSVRPDLDRIRPPQTTPVPNLALAGDWTRTGWPATMEGAVRSGYLAAEVLLRSRGDRQPCLVPDLPRGWLARLLLA